MGAGYPFRSKRSNIIFLNVFAGLWFAGVIVGSGFEVREAFQTHHVHNLWVLLLMPVAGIVVYGANRLFLDLAYRERSTASEADIEDARRMLYGDKDKPGE